MQRSLNQELERYVRTGHHHNDLFFGWPGSDILREAVASRNGWKRTLARYAPPPRARHAGPRA